MEKPELTLQPKPLTIKIEFTEGCNLSCFFCAIRSIRKKPRDFRFLQPVVLREILLKIKLAGWNVGARFELAMHGEPLYNPNALKLLSMIREECPYSSVMLMTNGHPIVEGKMTVEELLQFVNVLAIDNYSDGKIINQILDNTSIKPLFYPAFNIYKRHPHTERKLVVVGDIATQTLGSRKLHNIAGNSAPLDYSRQHQRCYRPFRECAINYLGEMLLCCNDWKKEFVVGSVLQS